jgi:hypothetical protein
MYTIAHFGTIAVVEPGVCYPVLGWSAYGSPIVANTMGGTRPLCATEYVWVGEITLTPEELRPDCPIAGSVQQLFQYWHRLDWDPKLRREDLTSLWRGKAGQ